MAANIMRLFLLFLLFLININSQAFDFSGDMNSRSISPDNYILSATYPESNNRVYLNWKISEGSYLYKDKIGVKIINSQDPSLFIKGMVFPKGYYYKHTVIGNFAVYSDNLKLPIILNKIPTKNFDIEITYQGCSSSGFCYAPVVTRFAIDIINNHAIKKQDSDKFNFLNNNSSDKKLDKKPDKNLDNKAGDNNINKKSKDILKNNNQFGLSSSKIFAHSIFVIILICFGLGVLLSFTPCVLPMVPILSSIILGQKSVNMKRGFLLSLTYVFSMAITYTILGVLVSLLGKNFQVIFQKPIFLILLSLLFIILALGLVGFFNLKFFAPISKLGVFNKFNKFSLFLNNRVKGGSYLGVFGMGVLATIIVSPCVTPPLVGILVYIAQSGNVILGGVALFALGLGMGVPLLIVGSFGPKFLPKRGRWMVIIKFIFSFLLLCVAASLLWRVIPTHSVNNKAPNYLYINNNKDLNKELSKADISNKPVIIDFYADWCLDCKIMNIKTFANKDVKKSLDKFVFIHVDMTKQTKDIAYLQKKFGVIAPPSIIFYKSGKFLDNYKILGEIGPKEFNKVLLKILSNHSKA